MSEAQHDLASEFPKYKDLIHQLKLSDGHFGRLFEEYHDLNKSIHRAETRVDVISETEEEQLRKQRLKVKDELYQMLQKAESNN